MSIRSTFNSVAMVTVSLPFVMVPIAANAAGACVELPGGGCEPVNVIEAFASATSTGGGISYIPNTITGEEFVIDARAYAANVMMSRIFDLD